MRISGHKNTTLARLLDEPDAEFPCCIRCNNDMPVRRENEECADCEGAAKYHPRGVQGTTLPPYNPAYEVSLHYDQHPKLDPTIATLEARNITYMVYTSKRDSIEVEWAKNLPSLGGSKGEWPIVLITSHGEVIDWWTGFDLFQLNIIPAARAAAIQMSQTPHDFVTCVPSREQVAA